MGLKKINDFFEKINKKLNWYDISIIKISTFIFALLVAKYFPIFLEVNHLIYISLILISLTYLFWKMFIKNL